MPSATPTPAERFASLVLGLVKAVDTRGLCGLLARPLVMLIISRVHAIRQTIVRLAARVSAGTWRPRRVASRCPRTETKPRAKNPLPHEFGWLLKLVPEAAASGSQLQMLLADPEFAALLQAAPAALRRPLRSLCRMLAVMPPASLALPPSARPQPPPRPKIPRQKPLAGFSPDRPMGRVRYVFGLRYPPPLPDPA